MTDERCDESAFLQHEACPECGSRDNLARYASGRGHCHGCGHNEFPADDGGPSPRQSPRNRMSKTCDYSPIDGELGGDSLTTAYGINTQTRRETGISLVSMGVTHLDTAYPRKPCVAFDYRLPTGELWGQKVRYKLPDDAEDDPGGKTFRFPHAKGCGPAPLWLMHKWGTGSDRRSLVVWEGEGDCAAYYQVTGGKYPCVSLPNGAKSAEEGLKAHYEWIDQFDKIVLVFDADETGREWAKKAAALLPPGKAHVGEVPNGHKDAREALMAGDAKAIQQAYWNATPFRPDGIFTLTDIREAVLTPPQEGRPWWNPTVTGWTYGRRDGEVYLFGAGTGIGKTDWFTQSIAFDVLTLNIKCGVIYLEQPPGETGKRIAGKAAGKAFHVPDGSWTQDELVETFDKLEASGNLFLGGNFSAAEWDSVKSRIRFMRHALGVEHLYLDHITAMVDPSNEQASVGTIIKELALLAQELGMVIHAISHLATPEGKPHEEGGRVSAKHFRGSRALQYWAHYMFGLERDTQAVDPALRNITTFRCVKDRYTGRAAGNTMFLRYDAASCQLVECEAPQSSDDATGFTPFDPQTGEIDV